MIPIVALVLWVAIGAVVAIVEGRRGHWSKAWVLDVILGPLSIPVALNANRREGLAAPRLLSSGDAGGGDVDILVGIDGSSGSLSGAAIATTVFGPRIGRITLATVLDFDTAGPPADATLSPEPWEEEDEARALLESAAATVRERTGHTPDTVLLPGNPARALAAYATENGYEAVVIGCRGRGLSKAVFGSCAEQLAGRAAVPLLLVPEPAVPRH